MNDDLFERRRAERHTTLHFLEYDILSPEGHVEGMGMARTVNISSSGLLLETGRFFETGQRLRVTLGLNNILIKLIGVVVHSRPINDDLCDTGVMFIEFSEADRQIYQAYYRDICSAADS
jgi:hypothetical protein